MIKKKWKFKTIIDYKSKYIKISSTVKSKVHEKSLSLFEIIHNKSEIRKEKQKNPLNSF